MDFFAPFRFLFSELVYKPQLNLFQFFFNITGDPAVSIILIALVVNLLIWPMIAKNYVNGQKIKLLNPKIQEINNKYKLDRNLEPKEVIKIMKEKGEATKVLYREYGIDNSIIWWTILIQLFYISFGLFHVIGDTSKQVDYSSNLYSFLQGSPKVSTFSHVFGLDLTLYANNYIFIAVLSMIASHLYGKYTIKWQPQVKIPKLKAKTTPKTKSTNDKDKSEEDKPEFAFDPEEFQKSQEFNIIWLFPIIQFTVNLGLSTALSVYFTALSIFNLLRQMAIAQYYHNHISELAKKIIESDPHLYDLAEKEGFVNKEGRLEIKNPDTNFLDAQIVSENTQITAVEEEATKVNINKKESKKGQKNKATDKISKTTKAKTSSSKKAKSKKS